MDSKCENDPRALATDDALESDSESESESESEYDDLAEMEAEDEEDPERQRQYAWMDELARLPGCFVSWTGEGIYYDENSGKLCIMSGYLAAKKDDFEYRPAYSRQKKLGKLKLNFEAKVERYATQVPLSFEVARYATYSTKSTPVPCNLFGVEVCAGPTIDLDVTGPQALAVLEPTEQTKFVLTLDQTSGNDKAATAVRMLQDASAPDYLVSLVRTFLAHCNAWLARAASDAPTLH